jgi:hypothetical protein
VLGRTVLIGSGCLNTGSCSFHLVSARGTRVAGWCKGELLFSVIQVGCLYDWKLVLETLRELVCNVPIDYL